MLEGKNISYSPLFEDLSFTLSPGNRITVRGENGSGKSTLLRLLTGLIRPQPSPLFWKGKEVKASLLTAYQQEIVYISHKLCLHQEALVKDQVRLWQNLYGLSLKPIEDALEIWGISHAKEKKIAHLSQGQQKRLSLSRCHWLKRSLWILDEPDAGLDQIGKATLNDLCKQHLSKGGMLVLATHEDSPCNTSTLTLGLP
ncbi:MAG: heme ABC exporter ATP-binding protein CcmA [Alphaproteobacteria bacterium]|nr:heme ABC exporter ATP-binding protein CcmA [Alphaproteobacteria bacterium]